MITFNISNIHVEPDNIKLRDKWELLINIEADFEVIINSISYYNEQTTIVELAVELKKWLNEPVGTTFKYETIDDDETDIFDIIAISSDSYKFNSAWQQSECNSTFTKDEVNEFIKNYIQSVRENVKNMYGINLNEKIGL